MRASSSGWARTSQGTTSPKEQRSSTCWWWPVPAASPSSPRPWERPPPPIQGPFLGGGDFPGPSACRTPPSSVFLTCVRFPWGSSRAAERRRAFSSQKDGSSDGSSDPTALLASSSCPPGARRLTSPPPEERAPKPVSTIGRASAPRSRLQGSRRLSPIPSDTLLRGQLVGGVTGRTCPATGSVDTPVARPAELQALPRLRSGRRETHPAPASSRPREPVSAQHWPPQKGLSKDAGHGVHSRKLLHKTPHRTAGTKGRDRVPHPAQHGAVVEVRLLL